MGNESRWIRLNIDWFESEWVLAMSAEAQNCWIKLLCRMKANGYAGTVKLGPIHHLARIWYVGEESVRQMLKAGELSGALTCDGDIVTLTNWALYQGDSTNAERQRRFKSKGKDNTGNDSNALLTQVTVNKDKDKDNPPKSPKGDKKVLVDFEGAVCPDCLKEAALIWQSYKRAKGQAWKMPTWERNFAKYADEPFKFALMVDYTIERGYQGLLMPEGKGHGSAAPSLMERTGGKGV